jgi:hypothetical protein
MSERRDNAFEVKATLDELVGMGKLVTIYDPACGEDRYCTPEFKDFVIAQRIANARRLRKSARRRVGSR